ncbi:cancer/testis antigen 55-like [Peromyscus maniculatus bairdii]|uniref:cancer/testis antigen 55-like n=1 Tax=Peromyscus maniculatus bairdii TaxID=230844 RepID=UPI003FCFC2C1
MQRLWQRISAIFQWKTGSEETPQEQLQDISKLKTVRGIVTTLCTDCGWINESIFFNTDMLYSKVPLNTGTSVIALVEENETTHIQKAIKVKTMTDPVDEFMPYKGDLLLVEYSMKTGTSNMDIHTVSPLSSQNMDEVCVTSTDGKTGVVESCIFFTEDSLQKPTDYTPGLYDIVNVVAVDSIQPHCSWRAVSMIPVEMYIDQAL